MVWHYCVTCLQPYAAAYCPQFQVALRSDVRLWLAYAIRVTLGRHDCDGLARLLLSALWAAATSGATLVMAGFCSIVSSCGSW